MVAYSKLIDAVVSLIDIRRKVAAAGEFGTMYEVARDALFEAFDALAQNPTGGPGAIRVCTRDDAMLIVLVGMGPAHGVLCHLAKDKSTMIQNEHETAGDRGSIVVDGHLWRWSEMVDGVIAAFGLVTASMYAASHRNIAEVRREFDERKKAQESARSPAVEAQMTSESAFLLAVMKANFALFETEAVVVAGYIPSAQQLTEAEKAFIAAVDAGAAYVKESKIDPIVVGSKGNNNLVIDEKGLAVIFPGGSAHITIDDLGNTPFATFYVEDRGVRQTWLLRDALTSMKTYLGWKGGADTTKAASTEVAS